MTDDVVLIPADALRWPFTAGNGEPNVSLPPTHPDGWRQTLNVDPFPGYAHDTGVVAETFAHVKEACQLDPSPIIYVLCFEPPARTNGWAESQNAYVGEDREYTPVAGRIVLAGKRIPPHPAVTRYLVAHEYGHHVEYQLLRRRGLEPGDDTVRREYAEMRGCTDSLELPYSGGYWHASVGELFANDFRLLIAGVEPEFWPHPGFPRPHEVDGLAEWWVEALAPTPV